MSWVPDGGEDRSRLRDVLCLRAVLKSVFWGELVRDRG